MGTRGMKRLREQALRWRETGIGFREELVKFEAKYTLLCFVNPFVCVIIM